MKKERIIFQNSKRYVNEGNGIGEGLLYCGQMYTSPNGCPCTTCDGQCGPDNGCPCPDCDNTLSYILFSTGKMKCEICKKSLIRIKVCTLNLFSEVDFTCNICLRSFFNILFIPLMFCMKCKYKLCPKCAFSKLTFYEQKKPYIEPGFKVGEGMIYCKKNYADNGHCLCAGCDGNCGPEKGCQCPLCDSILGYNIYLKSNLMECNKCKRLLVKTTFLQLKKKYGDRTKSFKCSYCPYQTKYDFENIYFCYKCKFNICKACAFKNNIVNIQNIVFPKYPLFLDNMEKEIEAKINKKKIAEIKVDKQKGFKIVKKNVYGKNISIYLKTLIGRIYTININESENVRKLKEELTKIDGKYRIYNTILIYKNKIMDDDEYLSDYELDNESLIDIISK